MALLARAHPNVAGFVALAVFAIVCLYPVLDARFVLVDDHEIRTFAAQARQHPDVTTASSLASVIAREAETIGRFRPAYWAIRLGEVRVLGENPSAWHALVLLLAIASGCMVFWVARRLGMSTLPAMLAASLLMVGPGVSSLWVRLGPPETIATVLFLTSLCAAIAARRGAAWDVVFVAAGVLAMLAKEPFALTGLALAGFRLAQPGSGLRSVRGLVVSALILAAGVVVLVADYRVSASAGTTTYGGRYLAGTGLVAYAVTVAHNGMILVYASCAWVVAFVALAVWRRVIGGQTRTRLWLAGLLVAAVVLPQLGLYSLQGVMEGRYEVPSTIALSLLAAASLHLPNNRLAVATFGLSVVLFGFSTWTYASAFAAESRQLDAMLTTLANRAPTGGVVALAVDPGRRYEPALALVDELAARQRTDLAVRLVALNEDGPYTPDEAALAQNLATQLPPLQSSDCDHLGGVILLADAADWPDACPRDSLRPVAFTEDVLLWGGETVSFRPRLPATVAEGYRAYIP